MVRRILIPVYIGHNSQLTARQGLEMARVFKASVTFLFVADEALSHWLTGRSYPSAASVSSGDTTRTVAEQVARMTLEHIDALARATGVPSAALVRHGSAVEHILEEARRHELVVLGARERSSLDTPGLGSVAEAVARRSPTTVIVVRGETPWVPEAPPRVRPGVHH